MSKHTVIGMGDVGKRTVRLLQSLDEDVRVLDKDSTKIDKQEFKIANSRWKTESDYFWICTSETVLDEVFKELHEYSGVRVVRSTTKPYTCERLENKYGVHVMHLPCFCKERDLQFKSGRLVLGYCCEEHAEELESILRRVRDSPYPKGIVYLTSREVSEMTKLVTNTFLATLISYWNEVSKLSEELALDPSEVVRLAKLDNRIPHYGTSIPKLGEGFGGKCLPKDLEQFIDLAISKGVYPKIAKAVENLNKEMKDGIE